MTLFRGYADDLPLMEWLERHIWPAEAKLEAEDVYWGTRLACAEMIRTGTVRFWDMYWQPGATARAVADAGPARDDRRPADRRRPGGEPREAQARGGGGPRRARTARRRTVDSIAGPARDLHRLARVAGVDRRAFAAERPAGPDPRLGDGERGRTTASSPRRAARRAPRPPRRARPAHRCSPIRVWLDEAERELIAARGATVVTNPVANMKLAVGAAFDLPAARGRGIPVGLGTDGAGSNNSLDLLADAKHLALLQKHRGRRRRGGARRGGARDRRPADGRRCSGRAGSPPGEPADFLLVRTDRPELGSARWRPASSTRRRARSWTRRWSRDGS